MQSLRVLNLGAGVQSTTLFLMIMDGELPPVDFAVFADVGDEPAAVYDHLAHLKSLGGPEIHTVSRGNLGDNLISGVNATGQRFVSIPAHLSVDGERSSIGRRQCTSEYKILPIEQFLRQRIGVAKGNPIPKGVTITQLFGLSYDEPRRVDRVKANSKPRWAPEFPLFDDMMTRDDCVAYLRQRLPDYVVPRSACVFCPYKRDSEWIALRDTDPQGWARAVQIDNAIRDPTSVCTRDMIAQQYLHKSCTPLELVQLRPDPPDRQRKMSWADMDCEGMCGV
jgi:hypothetical protein